MLPERIRVADGGGLDPAGAARVAEVLDGGGLVAYPTETFYGIAASPWRPHALERLLALKGERGAKPVPLVLASAAAVLRVAASVPAALEALAAAFWPGPLTLVVPARADLSPAITAGTGSVGVRVPGHPVARAVARAGSGAVTSTSANASAAPPPASAQAVIDGLGGALDLVIDGGTTPGGLASTVLDLREDPPRVVRAGAIPERRIAGALGRPRAG